MLATAPLDGQSAGAPPLPAEASRLAKPRSKCGLSRRACRGPGLGVRLWLVCGTVAVCVVPVLAAPIGSQQTRQPKADETPKPAEVLAATAKFAAGEPEAAFALLQAAAAAHASLPPAHVMLANLYFSAGQVAAARRHLERAAVEHPADPEAFLSFGDMALRAGRWTAAESLYARSGPLLANLEAAPERQRQLRVRLQAGRAGVAEARQQWTVAEQALLEWLALEPTAPQVQVRLGMAAAWQGRAGDAEARFQQAYDLDNGLLPVPLAMGEQFRRQGDGTAARRWFEQAVETLPADVRPRVALARLHWEQEELTAAAEQAAAAVNLAPDSQPAALIRGMVARYQGEQEQAVASLEQVLDRDPGHFMANDQLALVLCEGPDPLHHARARALAEQNRRQHPNSLVAMATLGWVHFQLQEHEPADRWLGQLANARRRDRNQSFYLAAWHAHRGRPQAAAEPLRRAREGTGPFAYSQAAEALARELASDP